MKTTRILGFVAGVMAIVALIAFCLGMIAGLTKLGILSLVTGVGVMAVSLLPGIAHLLLRIKYRNPYRSRRGQKRFLLAGRILMWAWGVIAIATLGLVIYLAIEFGPSMLSLVLG